MRIARFTTGEDPRYGILDEDSDELVVLRSDPIFAGLETTGERVALDTVRLLSPVIPRSKVIGIGRNYADHAAEMGHEVPAEPLVFLKPNTSVIGPDDPIVLPPWSREVHHEAELAVVISRLCKYVPAAKVQDVIFGYTVANDVTARDVQATDAQWTRAKGFDTSCPLGPYLAVDLDVSDLAVRARVDGVVRQDGRTSDLVHKVPELIEYVSSIFTLLPGDVILTGTPAGVGPIEVGQRVEVEVEGIGSFSNPVVRRD
ncbi:fumarylacetoacetate hydrolase family protein [Georgenia muralis]|uniref:2-keto-4-pentenoate hydratase/2-oxohepta-3-ene-1,7-dioic acid hydratase in catechol pathway n=1 Tax=Georgenia muralis TaxID=154117 RepID=A0A3N4YYX6_9MICO|nr:fumarylacetoacetate hydrolase family protein [Georgenia muralis]RPF25673.1 2-keto-4-pentenoate hydratase/2-oxohepta-3-ene-1,7-dioic acid hydratase in catechol pathway [Georgenia muralis]